MDLIFFTEIFEKELIFSKEQFKIDIFLHFTWKFGL